MAVLARGRWQPRKEQLEGKTRWERRLGTVDLDTAVGLGHRERRPRLQSRRPKKHITNR